MDNNKRLSNEERTIMGIFIKLLKETGHLSRNVEIFPKGKIPEARLVVDKVDDKWVAYIYERAEISGYREYDGLYSLCLDVFEALDKNSTDYCVDIFVPLVEDIINNEFKGKKK